MGISLHTQKILWARSGGKCAICKRDLVIDPTHSLDDASIVGDEAHIVARSESFSRGDYASLSAEERDAYSNLILLCKIHHKQVDDQPNLFTVEKLKEIKEEHEREVRSLWTDADRNREQEDSIYASYVDVWSRFAHIDEWNNVSFAVTRADTPSIERRWYDDWIELVTWTSGRVWPRRYPYIESSMRNFSRILEDFLNTISLHLEFERDKNAILRTIRYYKIRDFDPEENRKLTEDFISHCQLVVSLFFELTRGANYLLDNVRTFLFPAYRIAEGVLLTDLDALGGMDAIRQISEYQEHERAEEPYPGLEEFKKTRFRRDMNRPS